jgi:ribosomal protein L37AE/L43A
MAMFSQASLEVAGITTTRLIENEDGAWECEGCGNLWVFTADGPEENGYCYCSRCGRKITEYVYMPEIDNGEGEVIES